MLFRKKKKSKTLKHLRKSQSLTIRELSRLSGVNESILAKVDNRKMKTIPEPIQTKIRHALDERSH